MAYSFLDYVFANLPPEALRYITRHTTTYWSLYQRFLTLSHTLHLQIVQPLEQTFFGPLTSRVSAGQLDLTTLILATTVLLISLQVISVLRRALIIWIRSILWIVRWTVVIGGCLWLWSRGFQGVSNDIEWMLQIWSREYGYWKRENNNAAHLQYRHRT